MSAAGLGGMPLVLPLALVVAVVLGLVVVALRGVEDLGIALLLLAVATATWNVVSVGGLQVVHVALAVSFLLLAGSAVGRRRRIVVPVWVWFLSCAVLLVGLLAQVWPTSASYLSRRTEVPLPPGVATTLPSFGFANAYNTLAWLLAAAALPIACCLAAAVRPAVVRLLAATWALGAAVNGAVALSDFAGLTAISAHLRGFVDQGGRQAGLASQPNHLAMAVAIVVPIAVWWVVRARSAAARTGWTAVVLVLAGAEVVSGSRGGMVGVAVGVLGTLLAVAVGRRVVLPLLGLLAGAALVVLAVAPGLVDRVSSALRFSGAASAQASDAIRAGVAEQALQDLAHSPLRGIGLPVVDEGHSIFLQLLASGGVLLFLGFVISLVGAVVDARAVSRGRLAAGTLAPADVGLPQALLCAIGVWLVVGAVENQLTDVYVYAPYALVAALCARGTPGSWPPSVPRPRAASHAAELALTREGSS